MATESQINANRQNALKSTWPRTQEGKEASSQNALKHGLRAKRNVIKTENQDEFEIYREKMIEDLSPDGAMEEMLAERIVSLSWRLKRAEHFQNAVIDALIEHGLHDYVSNWHDDGIRRAQKEAENGNMDIVLGIVINRDFASSKTLEQLLIYERRIESSLYRTIAELNKARRMRKEQGEAKNAVNRDSGLVARDSSGESELHICTNKPNLEDESGERHPHPEKDVQDEDTTRDYCTNEPNLPACCEKSEMLNNKEVIVVNLENKNQI